MPTDKPATAPPAPGADGIVIEGDPVELTSGRVDEFAAAVKYTGDGVPATILAPLTSDVQQRVMAHPQLRIDLARTLHTAQSFDYHRPLGVGDVLTATATVTSVRPMRGGRAISFVTRVVDAAGEVVQELGTTLLTDEAAGDETV